jgi:transposase
MVIMRQSKYSQEFKDSTVQLIINNNESFVQVVEDLDLNPKTLYHWVAMYKKAHKLPTKNINLSFSKESEHKEFKRLRAENKILKEERDILRKHRTSQKKLSKVLLDKRA